MSDIHIVKLAVGAESLEDLLGWEKNRPGVYHIHTRNRPTRWQELLDGGSLYWVIKGQIICRREIAGFELVENKDGASERDGPYWKIGLHNRHIATELQPKRPFQGWRYLKASETPRDIVDGEHDLPPEMARALKEAGVW